MYNKITLLPPPTQHHSFGATAEYPATIVQDSTCALETFTLYPNIVIWLENFWYFGKLVAPGVAYER